jgi:hypothetical protein
VWASLVRSSLGGLDGDERPIARFPQTHSRRVVMKLSPTFEAGDIGITGLSTGFMNRSDRSRDPLVATTKQQV